MQLLVNDIIEDVLHISKVNLRLDKFKLDLPVVVGTNVLVVVLVEIDLIHNSTLFEDLGVRSHDVLNVLVQGADLALKFSQSIYELSSLTIVNFHDFLLL